MNQFVARTLPPSARSDEGRGVPSPQSVPANPYELFQAETQRRYQILIQAGIDEDMAIECASFAAMEKAWRMNDDDFEDSNNVYGSA